MTYVGSIYMLLAAVVFAGSKDFGVDFAVLVVLVKDPLFDCCFLVS
jgi:hypothetical protein